MSRGAVTESDKDRTCEPTRRLERIRENRSGDGEHTATLFPVYCRKPVRCFGWQDRSSTTADVMAGRG